MSADPIFHLAAAGEWQEARRTGSYTGSTAGRSLADEGFVHCSFAGQVQQVADAFYRGRRDVVLLRVDPSLLDAEVRVEPAGAGGEMFPHVYGPIPVGAVVRADPVPPDNDGHLLMGDLVEDAL